MTNAFYNDNGSSFDDYSAQSFDSNISSADNSGSDVDDSTDLSDSGRRIKADDVKLAQQETNFVLCSKFLAYLVLFLSALGSGVGAFYLTRDQEINTFEDDVS